MKPKHLLLLFCILGLLKTNAQRPFITIWNTRNPGISANNQIIFRGTGTNYNISWVNLDDKADTGSNTATGTDTITFALPGTYQVYVTPGKGVFTAVKGYSYNPDLGISGDGKKLISIEQWGDIQWATFDSAFSNCIVLVINASDSPDLSRVADMSCAFAKCVSLKDNPPMSDWDVSHVTNMHDMFNSALIFNQPIGNWDVSNVTDMRGMFSGALIFNQPIGNWSVSNVTDMSDMFFSALKFNQSIGNWNVSKVTNMLRMFNQASAFNKPIGKWDVSNVTNMSEMFRDAHKFNQPIGKWNVSSLRYAGVMFNYASAFNQPIGDWNVANVTAMDDMFAGASSFNQPIGGWNISNVTNTAEMFMDAVAFNQPIGDWNVSNVRNMDQMFWGASKFNQPIGNWNVSNVIRMTGMFQGASTFNQPINTWNISDVQDMDLMFQNAKVFNQPLDHWDIGIVNKMNNMFAGAAAFNQPIGNWNVSYVANLSDMFAGATAFNQPIGNWNVSNVDNMLGMFNGAYAFNQDISNWNVSKVRDMIKMFCNAREFNQNLGSWNLSGAPTMTNMFDSSGMSCSNYSLILRGWSDSASTPNGLSLGAAALTYDSAFAKAAHDNLTNIKGWTITGDSMGHCSDILPVNFLSFSVTKQGNAALLNWSVANEINNKGYYVERSVNGSSFNSIGFIAGKSSAKQTDYTYTDNNLLNGTTYYRIKEIDNDGKYMYSGIQEIELSNFAWKIHGNPVNNSFIELMLNKPANISIAIISSNGNIIKTIKKGNLVTGNYRIPLNIDNVSAGLYVLRLMVDDKAYTSAVIKQ